MKMAPRNERGGKAAQLPTAVDALLEQLCAVNALLGDIGMKAAKIREQLEKKESVDDND
jgi:hypothetical protein